LARPAVAFLLPALEGGGAELATLRFRTGLERRRIPSELVVVRSGGRLASSARHSVLGSPTNILAIRDYVRWLRAHRPAVSLSALDNANIINLIASKLTGVRASVALHNTPAQDLLRNREGKFNRRIALARKLYPKAKPLLACGVGVAKDAATFFGMAPGEIRVVENPAIDPDGPAPAPFDFATPGPNILAVGRLTEAKGFDVLIRAFSRSHPRTGGTLTIFGEGPDREALQGLAVQCGVGDQVRLPGFHAEPIAAMRAADLFVLSSRWEGLPIALIEALYAGCRIVATNCPSGPDEILRAGELAELVPVEDAEQLSEAMERSLAQPVPIREPEHYARYTVDVGTARLIEVLGVGGSDA